MTRAQSCCCPRRGASRAACDPRRSPAAARGSVAGLGRPETPASPRGLSRGRAGPRGDSRPGVQMLPALAGPHSRPRRPPSLRVHALQEQSGRSPARRSTGAMSSDPAGRRAELPVGAGGAEDMLAVLAATFERDRHRAQDIPRPLTRLRRLHSRVRRSPRDRSCGAPEGSWALPPQGLRRPRPP
jgi:hypothetical protein